jgi:hypothetical protein
MNKKINDILKRFSKYTFLEENNFSNFLTNLKHIYLVGDDDHVSKKEQTEFSAFERSIGPVKPRFKRDFHCNIPWIDAEVWKNFKLQAGFSFPNNIKSETVTFSSGSTLHNPTSESRRRFRRESELSTSKCLCSYTSRKRGLSSIQRNCIGRSGIRSAESIRILSNNGRKDTIERSNRGIRLAVESAAKNTNSGFPHFRKKNSKFCIEDTILWLTELFNSPTLYKIAKNPFVELPSSLFYRVQPSIDDNDVNIKIRQVWGLPQRIVSLEYMFFKNIFERVYENNLNGPLTIYSSGLTQIEIRNKIVCRLKRQLIQNRGREGEKELYSLDYSKFDRSVPNHAIDLFFAICKEQLDMDDTENKVFNDLRIYIKFTPIVWKGFLFVCLSGIPSGSYLTNMIDTWWNLTLWDLSYCMEEFYKNNLNDFLNKGELFEGEVLYYVSNNFFEPFTNCGICGDDSLVLTENMHISIMINLCRSFGMEIEVAFQTRYYDQETYFLGRYWNHKNEPTQTHTYFVGHICVRTKFYNKDDIPEIDFFEELTSTRILSITLQFANGYEFLRNYFNKFEPIVRFLESGKGHFILKEYPLTDRYEYINRIDAFSWRKR